MTEAAKTAEYEVTERAGRRVAGRVVTVKDSLTLTEAEAEHGLAEGTIVPKGKELPKVFDEDSRATARMRGEAQAFRGRGEPPPADAPEPARSEAPSSAADPAQAKPAVGAKA